MYTIWSRVGMVGYRQLEDAYNLLMIKISNVAFPMKGSPFHHCFESYILDIM